MVGSIYLNWRKDYWAVHRHAGQAVGEVHFDFNDDAFKSNDSARKYTGKHVESLDDEAGKVKQQQVCPNAQIQVTQEGQTHSRGYQPGLCAALCRTRSRHTYRPLPRDITPAPLS